MGLKKSHPVSSAQNGLKETKSVDTLIAELNAPDPIIRHYAARELTGSRIALPALLNAIRVETDNAVLEVLFSAISPVCDESVVPMLISFLKSENAQTRNAAISLFQQEPALFARYVTDLLCDKDSDTRIFAVDIIGAIQHPDACEWLNHVIQSDDNINVVGTAIDKLSEIGDQSSLPVLQSAREKYAENGYLSFAIDAVICRIEGAGK